MYCPRCVCTAGSSSRIQGIASTQIIQLLLKRYVSTAGSVREGGREAGKEEKGGGGGLCPHSQVPDALRLSNDLLSRMRAG